MWKPFVFRMSASDEPDSSRGFLAERIHPDVDQQAGAQRRLQKLDGAIVQFDRTLHDA